MLQKGFFMTEPFNPDPYWDNTILNLSGASKFEDDTVFKPGIYSVDVQAGGGYSSNNIMGSPAIIKETIVVEQPFIIRGYCGSCGTVSSGGQNPYSGTFKVNAPNENNVSIPSVSHIFGNAGSNSVLLNRKNASGNCLGNGNGGTTGSLTAFSGAGSCLHIMPVGGTFGTDYLFAFHTTSGTYAGGGVGSAYGGAGSGSADGIGSQSNTSQNGGSTPYGNGGLGVTGSGSNPINGNAGTGIGYGAGGLRSGAANGSGAWFDGTQWNDSRTTGVYNSNGHIIIKYFGTIN